MNQRRPSPKKRSSRAKTKKSLHHGLALLKKRAKIFAYWMGAFLALVVINLYVFYYRADSPRVLGQLKVAERHARGWQGELGDAPLVLDKPKAELPKPSGLEYAFSNEMRLSRNVLLPVALKQTGLPRSAQQQILSALQNEVDVTFAEGQSIVCYFDRFSQWIATDFQKSETETVRVYRGKNQNPPFVHFYTGQKLLRVESIHGTISSAGGLLPALPPTEGKAVVYQLSQVFAFEADLPTQAQKDDSFSVWIEKIYQDGIFLRYGKILYAQYHGQMGSLAAIWVPSKEDAGAYYDTQGRSLTRTWPRSALLLSPVLPQEWTLAQLQPTWNANKKLTSYALYPAPAGTAVKAMVAGTIKACATGEGCTWKIVKNDFEVHYGNLHASVPGLKAGQHVASGQIIGFVTKERNEKRPALKLSLWKNGNRINPVGGLAPRGEALPDNQSNALQALVAQYQNQATSSAQAVARGR